MLPLDFLFFQLTAPCEDYWGKKNPQFQTCMKTLDYVITLDTECKFRKRARTNHLRPNRKCQHTAENTCLAGLGDFFLSGFLFVWGFFFSVVEG